MCAASSELSLLADAILAKIDLDGSCMSKSVFYRVATYDRPIIALITDKQRLLCFLYYYVGAKMDSSHASTNFWPVSLSILCENKQS